MKKRKLPRHLVPQQPAIHADPGGSSAARPARRRSYKSIAIVGGVVVALAVLVVGLIDPSIGSLTATARPAHGKELYGQYCVSCHGPAGRGELNWRYRERAAPALDNSGHAWHHEDAQLLEMILDRPAPDSAMPAWRGVLSRSDALDLVAYIKTLWTPYIVANCQGAKHMNCTTSHD